MKNPISFCAGVFWRRETKLEISQKGPVFQQGGFSVVDGNVMKENHDYTKKKKKKKKKERVVISK